MMQTTPANPTRSAATYLVRTPYSYCFRYTVPSDLQGVVGRKELRYSLRTGYLGQAKTKSRFLAVKVHKLFQELRERIASDMPIELTESQIAAIVAGWIQETLSDAEERRLTLRRTDTEIENLHDVYSDLRAEMKESLAEGTHIDRMGQVANYLLEEPKKKTSVY